MDKYPTKSIMTFKSGKFVFSSKHDEQKIKPLLVEAQILYETIQDLPILPDMASRLEEELIRRSIFGTAALEGSPLTEEKVAEIVSSSEYTGKTKKAEKEILNLKNVYGLIKVLPEGTSPFHIGEDLIKNIHGIITKDLEDKQHTPGKYRSDMVYVGDEGHGGRYTPPKILDDIKNLMKEYAEWINSDDIKNLSPIIRAALAHYYFGLIHPFGDGNGRTARVIEALLLSAAGIKYIPVMLSNFYYKNRDDYYWAFSKSIKNKDNDVTPFLEFILKGGIEELKTIKEKIIHFIRILTFRDYIYFLKKSRKLKQRQCDLLTIVLESLLFSFTFKDMLENPQFGFLYRDVSERTAKRDLENLCNQKLLFPTEEKKYQLNFKILG